MGETSTDRPMPEYAPLVPARLRFRLCPHCGRGLVNFTDEERIVRVSCPDCGWVHYPGNVLGAEAVVSTPGGVVFLFPPDAPPEAPAALPGGVVELGEHPTDAIVRECYEETGLRVEVVRSLGHWLWPEHPYGPMLHFAFEARQIGGRPRDGLEGRVEIRPFGSFPAISPARRGSTLALAAFLEGRGA